MRPRLEVLTLNTALSTVYHPANPHITVKNSELLIEANDKLVTFIFVAPLAAVNAALRVAGLELRPLQLDLIDHQQP